MENNEIKVNPNLVIMFLREKLSESQLEAAQWKAFAQEQAEKLSKLEQETVVPTETETGVGY
jgi:hypothetical protein